MYFVPPVSYSDLTVKQNSESNIYKSLLAANFEDYMSASKQSGRLQIQAGALTQKVSSVFSGLGIAAGALGGPTGLAVGFAVGNTIGKFVGQTASNRIYGQAISDVAEIYHQSRLRHSNIATALAYHKKMGEGIDTLRQNENKRVKDALQSMSV